MGKIIRNEEARKIELDILSQFADYCEKNQLRYYLAYGTLIGAIRHQGFIPWDNDVDVVMPRPDYERFIELEEKNEIASNIEAVYYKNGYTFPFIKLIDNRTTLEEHFLVTDKQMGIYIDVFPLDGMPETKKEQKRLYKKAFWAHKMYAFANYRFNTGSNLGIKTLKNLLYPVSRLVSSRLVSKYLDGLCSKYTYNNSKYVGNIVWGWDNPDQEIVLSDCFQTEYTKFEDKMFRIPKGFDTYLKAGYGNYMQLPPIEDQFVHQFEARWK